MRVGIEWKTGRPEEYGLYIVTLEDGSVATDEWYMFSDGDDWHYFGNHVIAWCKLGDIDVYKGGCASLFLCLTVRWFVRN